MKDWFVIVNPAAGGWLVQKKWPSIQAKLSAAQIPFYAHITEDAKRVVPIVSDAIESGYRKFIAVGGDGTLNLLVNGILKNGTDAKQIVVAVIPVGTGNDWIKTHNISKNISTAIDLIKKEKTVMHDIGVLNFSSPEKTFSQYFINIAGGAFDGFVAKRIEAHSLKSKKNILVYVKGIFEGLFNYPISKTKIVMDDVTIEEEVFSLNLGICKYSGGGMKMTPDAIYNDGLFDITIIKRISKTEVILNVPRLFNGTFVRNKKVAQYRSSKVDVFCNTPIPFEVDGEIIGDGTATFAILTTAINMVVK